MLFGARLFLGFVLPVVVAYQSHPLALLSILAGEVVDRLEFYLELDFVQPATELQRELERAVRNARPGELGYRAADWQH